MRKPRRTTTTNMTTDFYCNQKFWFVTVDLEKFSTASCCSASPHKVDLDWVEQNPGKIFNTPLLQQERTMMLKNLPVESCRAACWKPEEQNLPSRRRIEQGHIRSHTTIQASPESINIIIGTNCNMTCVYCCKYYSSAWRRDVAEKNYDLDHSDDRFTINNKDRILQKLSQKDISTSKHRQALVQELDVLYDQPGLKEVMISGGEPFLYLDLCRLLKSIPPHIEIKLFSGLGVDEKRFAKEISKLPENVILMISAENINRAYEFVRYGNTWQRFLNNMETIRHAGVRYRFSSTVSNITLPGLAEFIQYAGTTPINFSLCSDPEFLSINVLDEQTKSIVMQDERYPSFVRSSLETIPSYKQVQDFRIYIKEFAARRSNNFDFLPESMINWIG